MKERKSIKFVRHGETPYRDYESIRASDNPQASSGFEDQFERDLSEKGRQNALERSREELGQLDPAKDILFIVSSKATRALETAGIFIDEAKNRGFRIEQPVHSHSERAENIAPEIRTVKTLSLNYPNTLVGSIYNPDKYLHSVNWEALDEGFVKRWEKAREIINRDDKGSWAGNFLEHSEEIKKIFPEIRTAEEVYEKQFKKILKLVRFASKKIIENEGVNIRIFAFGHQDYLVYALNKYFEDHHIDNCESIQFLVVNDHVELKRRGKTAIIND